MKISALGGTLCILLLACTSRTPKAELPQAPDAIVRLWQESIDKNNFELARQLSTGEALAYISELMAYTGPDSLDWENNTMLNLRCQIIGDSAICTYHFEDELGEPDPGQLALKRVNGRWLVCRTDFYSDEPLDSLNRDGEEMLFPGDSVDEELE